VIKALKAYSCRASQWNAGWIQNCPYIVIFLRFLLDSGAEFSFLICATCMHTLICYSTVQLRTNKICKRKTYLNVVFVFSAQTLHVIPAVRSCSQLRLLWCQNTLEVLYKWSKFEISSPPCVDWVKTDKTYHKNILYYSLLFFFLKLI
jgi:hypothetical protein